MNSNSKNSFGALMTNIETNKRIARNTILLYLRMIFILGVTLYTSRIVLNILGAVDFGIYNVVGGIVTMLSFLNAAMSSATQRFLSFEIGKNDYDQLKKVFIMSFNIHLMIGLVILILAETIGFWFLNNKLNVPADRMIAANWVYQFSILSFLITVISVPYNAVVIAHERMKVYAYVSIVEVILKLFVLFVLIWLGLDKLKLYATLVFLVSIIIWFIYKLYCNRYFYETHYRLFWDKTLFKTLANYAGWNFFGNMAVVTMNQGVNIFLNIFFGPAINAARGIAYQVNSAVNGFVNNFQLAINPQIVKSYSVNDIKYMHELILRGSKYSFYLLFIITFPVLLETEIILDFWLKEVPDYTVIFTRLILVDILIDSLSGTLKTAAQATGKIKLYQLVVGGVLLFNLPVSFIFLKLGFLPQITIYVSIIISIIALFLRLVILKSLILLSMRRYIIEVVCMALLISICSAIVPVFFRCNMEPGPFRLFFLGTISLICTFTIIALIGLNKMEKTSIKNIIFNNINR